MIDRRANSLTKNRRDVVTMLSDVPLLTFIYSVPGLQSIFFVRERAWIVHCGVLHHIYLSLKEIWNKQTVLISLLLLVVNNADLFKIRPFRRSLSTSHAHLCIIKQRDLLRDGFNKASEAHFCITHLALHHSKCMHNLRSHFSFCVFEVATYATYQLFFYAFITAGPCSNRSDHRVVLILRTFFNDGVTCVDRDTSFLSIQQLIDQSYVRYVELRLHHTVHDPPHSASIPTCAFISKRYWHPFFLWCISEGALTVLIRRRTRSTTMHWRRSKQRSPKKGIDDLKNLTGQLILFWQSAELKTRGLIRRST